MPKMLVQFARAGLRDPQVIRLDVESKISENLRVRTMYNLILIIISRQLAFFALRTEEKPAALTWLLREFIPQDQQAIVFCCTKHHVEFVYQLLNAVSWNLHACSNNTVFVRLVWTALLCMAR